MGTKDKPITGTDAAARDAAQTESNSPVKASADGALKTRHLRADNAVKNYMLVALGIGLIPVPVLDLAAFMGGQFLMVRRICQIYGVPFKGNRVRGALAAIAGTVGSASVAGWLGFSMSKLIPGTGTAVSLVALPVANAAFTFVVGRVFIAHFEAGGTLLDFNASEYVDHVKELYSEGKAKAASLLEQKDAGASETTAAS